MVGNPLDTKHSFSLVCPLYQTPVGILRQTIQSVQNQSYPYWELCLTLCDEEAPELQTAVRAAAEGDPRIRVIPLKENRGISENTNAALSVAQGAVDRVYRSR